MPNIFGQFSKDGYSYWGYVDEEGRMMEFVSPEEYDEHISEPRPKRKEPYWKQEAPIFTRITTPIMIGGDGL